MVGKENDSFRTSLSFNQEKALPECPPPATIPSIHTKPITQDELVTHSTAVREGKSST